MSYDFAEGSIGARGAKAVRLGLTWLLEPTVARRTNDECYWCGPWVTGEVLRSLLDGPVGNQNADIIEPVVRYLLSTQIPNGPHAGSWDTFTWDTAIVVRALVRSLNRIHNPDLQQKADRGLAQASQYSLQEATANYVGRSIPSVDFGVCYIAQTAAALGETDYFLGRKHHELAVKNLVDTLKNLQLPDGSWGSNHFDTAQVLEALHVLGVSPSERWNVQGLPTTDGSPKVTSYQGGIQRAVDWIEGTLSPDWSWGGLTWPTALTLNAYLLSAEKPRLVYFLRPLKWILDGQIGDGSWFHEIDRTPSTLVALEMVLNNPRVKNWLVVPETRLEKDVEKEPKIPSYRMAEVVARDSAKRLASLYKLLSFILGSSTIVFLYLLLWKLFSLDLLQVEELIGTTVAILTFAFEAPSRIRRFLGS